MVIGRHTQPGVAGAYAVIRERDEGVSVRITHAPGYQLFHHVDEPRFATSLDCWQTINSELTVLEIKTTTSYPDEPFDDWVTQLQWEMFCTGKPGGTIVALCGGDTMRWWDMEVDPDIIGPLVVQANQFLRENLDLALPPTPGVGDEAAVRSLYPNSVEGSEISMGVEEMDVVINLLALEAQGKDIKAQAGALKAQLQAVMGEAEVAYLPNGVKVSWKTHERKGYTVQPGTMRKFLITEPKR